LLVSFNNASDPYLTSYTAIRITQSSPFAASSSSASSIGASFLSSSLDGYNQPVSVPSQVAQIVSPTEPTIDTDLSQPTIPSLNRTHKRDKTTKPAPTDFFVQGQSSTASASTQPTAESLPAQKPGQIFDDLFAHEQVGEHHLPFRAAGNRLVASDAWIYDNSGFQNDNGMTWNEKTV